MSRVCAKRRKPDSENEVVKKGMGELKPETAKSTSKFNCLKIWKTGKASSRWFRSLLPEKSTARKLQRYASISVIYQVMLWNSINTYVFTGAWRTVCIGLWI